MTTHALIPQFGDLIKLSHPLANRLAAAVLNNSQVRWIHNDEDVKEFITKLLEKQGANIIPESKRELEILIAPPPPVAPPAPEASVEF